MRRIFEKAGDKLGPDIDQDGSVPPRVLKGIFAEGQFCDDELGAEYLGGVLASSRTPVARDDRGASLVALIGRLSTYQLRAHYIMYSTARRSLVGADLNLGDQNVRLAQPLFLPLDGLSAAFDLNADEVGDFQAILEHTVNGLLREALIEDQFSYGPADHLRTSAGRGDRDFGTGGVTYRISPLGVELYCAAHGIRGRPLERFLDTGVEFRIAPTVTITERFGLVADLPEMSQPP